MERTTSELVFFAITCLGIFVIATGAITASKPAAVTGVVLAALGLFYFLIKQD